MCCSVLQCVAGCCSGLHCDFVAYVEVVGQQDCVVLCGAGCCSVLQCVVVCCVVFVVRRSMLQCIAACCNVLWRGVERGNVISLLKMKGRGSWSVCCSMLQCAAVCWTVLQCVAVCCSVLQCVAVCCSVLQGAAVCYLLEMKWGTGRFVCCVHVWVRQSVDVCCTPLPCVAVCCSMLPCVAVCYRVLQ